MLIYTEIITPRLEYMADFSARELGVPECQLTQSREEYEKYEGIKINYSHQPMEADRFYLRPYGLLFEKEIRDQQINCFYAGEWKAFFAVEKSDYPFDIFSASFYLITRYEEYFQHNTDRYGRYAHEQSLACKEGFLNRPLVNLWFQHFKKCLKVSFPEAVFQEPVFSFLPTYDIDEAFAFKHKSFVRTWGGRLKSLLRRDIKEHKLRNAVLSGTQPDPYDAFDYMDALNRKAALFPIYFFLVPDKAGRHDKNISIQNGVMQELLTRHASKYRIGVHPSWRSGDEHDLLQKEISSIEKVTGKKVAASRQHFIRFRIPDTYRQLEKAGISEDYSMGYGSINGFRASVCTPYYWYDLGAERQTTLMLFPFCYMEANSFFEQRQTPREALAEMRHYLEATREVNGMMITIWHNTFLGTAPRFKGWREMYEVFVGVVRSSEF